MNMINKKISSTILEYCGITDEIIRHIKKKGLIIPDKIKPVKEPLKSPSEEWFYSIADRFTPPLTEAEVEVYKNSPHLLCLDILKAVSLFIELSNVLYEALEKVKINLKNEEAIAAILSVLRIFHGCLDNNYLKYDRHLEYHEFEKSPVGYYWKKLKNICIKAARKAEVMNPDNWAEGKILKLISGPRRMLISSEYAICCELVYRKIKEIIPNVNKYSIKQIEEKINKDYPDFFEVIKKYSKSFYRLPEEFIKDSIFSKETNPLKDAMKSKKITMKVIEEISSILDDEDAEEFERVVEAIEDFLAIQELEGIIAYGIAPNIKNHLFDVLDEGYDQLNSILLGNMEFVKPRYREPVRSLLRAEDVPSKHVALRKIMSEGDDFFVKKVEVLLANELRRWRVIEL